MMWFCCYLKAMTSTGQAECERTGSSKSEPIVLCQKKMDDTNRLVSESTLVYCP